MQFSTEQLEFAAAVRKYCSRELASVADRDRVTDGGTLSNSPGVLRDLARQGWLGVSLPAEYGGGGAGFVDECVFIEAAARGLAPITGYFTGLTAAQTYLKWGTDSQRRTVVSNLVSGRLEAIALSEPGSGSDLASLRVTARRDGDRYLVDGQKTWISAAHVSEHILVLTREDTTGSKHQGMTLLMVPTDSAGLEIRPIDTMEPHTCNDVFFDEVEVPTSAVVGVAGDAWNQLMRGLAIERMIIAAMSIGAAQRAFDDVVAYCRERKQFGRAIGSFQALRHRMADLATNIDIARVFVYDVASKIDAGLEDDLAKESAMAKMRCTEVAKQTALEAMQMMGGYGYAREGGMESQVRRALAPPIYGGTNEIQREIIARHIGL
ncbi:acyl-CoA dehydrogenase family protein [Rhodococcus cercidiphylli]|uniref:Acyl-CoA dehydrogenase family protein n=1 Tax=Rhodococcus cercidiphylli TaxID=489916 RepID=A0ABU4AWK4_9NOCA|nr:acyl-CoA dehydrogenase family protein [Rhodococcus cercidiphylli]MDV6230625.1 acyl-CoA dehydrogenase family protein [Rhodococcus cercidiphylli]